MGAFLLNFTTLKYSCIKYGEQKGFFLFKINTHEINTHGICLRPLILLV